MQDTYQTPYVPTASVMYYIYNGMTYAYYTSSHGITFNVLGMSCVHYCAVKDNDVHTCKHTCKGRENSVPYEFVLHICDITVSCCGIRT